MYYATVEVSVPVSITFIMNTDFKMNQLVCKATYVAFKHLQFGHDSWQTFETINKQLKKLAANFRFIEEFNDSTLTNLS